MFSSRLSEDALAARADADRPGHGPMSSAMTSASGGSARTACTVHVHGAGDTSGYVAYGVERVRSLQPSLRANPYQKIKVQPHGSGGPQANIVSEEPLSTLDSLSGLASPQVSASPSADVPESPVPSSDFEDAVHEQQLHREASVSVERCRCRGKPMVFKKYLENTMPTHCSLQDQQIYELNLYYKELRGLNNIVQILGHFWDECCHLTFVFPDLGANVYPTDPDGIVSHMKQLLTALNALWHREIIHCNIKGGSKPNAIFDSTGRLTPIDFESDVHAR